MALHELVRDLKATEEELLKQLSGVRSAISSLEFGGAVSPGIRGRKPGRPAGSQNRKGIIIVGGRPAIRAVPTIMRETARGLAAPVRKRRKLSPEGRAAIVRAQKARWAKVKAAKK